MKNHAFTLVEVLIVILIIGVLAAIAYPQYSRAILRSRFTQMKTAIKAIYDAQERYYLSNGTYAERFDELDLELGTFNLNKPKEIYLGKTWCELEPSQARFTCRFGYSKLIVQNWHRIPGGHSQQCCVYRDDNFKGEELCQELKNKKNWKDYCGGQGACHCY